ncbi:MAG: hypothetical protein ACRDIU_11450 [Actinomycetota bacterium]
MKAPPSGPPADETVVLKPETDRAEKRRPPERPKVASGIELIGKYEDSGYKNPPYLARRADGQTISLSQLLFLVAEQADGNHNLDEIAAAVSTQYGKSVSADNVAYLVEEKLQPLGMMEGAGDRPPDSRPDPLLALKFKKVLIPQGAVNALAGALRPLFWPPVILVVLVAFAAMDVWYFGVHGVAQGIRHTLYSPSLILMIYGLLVASVGWHELGHATACRYGGARPGHIGFGIYIVWPAFYTDVTDAYRLGKGGRVRTDLGGVYFNMIFALGCTGVYLLTRFEPLLIVVLLQHLLISYQFMPFLRLDGYYVISDLTGVPDLFTRVKPILRSLVPGRKPGKEVRALKKWVRVVVTAWVLLVIPFLAYAFVTMVVTAPRVLATGYDSFTSQLQKVKADLSRGSQTGAAAGSLQMGMLVLPMAGMTVTFGRVGKRVAAGLGRLGSGRPGLRLLAVGLLIAGVTFAAWALAPGADYKPIGPDEKGTVQGSVAVARRAVVLERPGADEASPEPEVSPSPTETASPSPSQDSSSPSPSPSGSASPTPTGEGTQNLNGGTVE